MERLQEISNEDAKAEGVGGIEWGHGMDYGGKACYTKPYRALWEVDQRPRLLGRKSVGVGDGVPADPLAYKLEVRLLLSCKWCRLSGFRLV